MNYQTQPAVRAPLDCRSCGNKHWTQRELWACETFGPVTMYRAEEPITPRQLNYAVNILGGDESLAKGLTKKQASAYIDDLKAGRAPKVAQASQQPIQHSTPTPAPQGTWTLQTPQAMVMATRDGRFAVRHDDNEPYKFIRIFRPKTGKKKGALVLQTQHSEAYKDCVIIWPSGRVSVYDRRIDDFLLLVVVDPVGATRAYAKELGRCGICGRELTDGRSIHYGIGPECEKSWPEIISQIDDEFGHSYYPGIVPMS